MKALLIVLLSFASLNSFATNPEYVACRATNSEEYDVAVEFVNNNIERVATLEGDLKNFSPVEKQNIISIVYAFEYDTEFGYDISLPNSSTEKVQLVAWSRGFDTDNYYGSPSQVATECHLLKSKPSSSVMVGNNVARVIPVEKL